jgi:acetyl-CoA C-acetyltransferase
VLDKDYVGSAVIESYTLFHDRDGGPSSGVVVARTPSGARSLCHIDVADLSMLAFFMAGAAEPVGQHGTIALQDDRRVWQK